MPAGGFVHACVFFCLPCLDLLLSCESWRWRGSQRDSWVRTCPGEGAAMGQENSSRLGGDEDGPSGAAQARALSRSGASTWSPFVCGWWSSRPWDESTLACVPFATRSYILIFRIEGLTGRFRKQIVFGSQRLHMEGVPIRAPGVRAVPRKGCCSGCREDLSVTPPFCLGSPFHFTTCFLMSPKGSRQVKSQPQF
ncbi:unnamed protein product, partial [Hapterophycus canaliculatus]